MGEEPFKSYVEQASEGRGGLWSIVIGFVVIFGTWIAGTFAAFALAAFFLAVSDPQQLSVDYVDTLLRGRAGAVLLFVSIGSMWAGVWLALRYVHRRPFNTVLGANLQIDRNDMARALVATLIVSFGTALPWVVFEGVPARTATSISEWLVWLTPMLVLVLLQTSAEEVAFRGYLVQALARRFRAPAIWAGIPMVIFTLMHWYYDASGTVNAAALLTIAAFALAATLLVYLTGNLGAAMGLHLGINIAALLVFSGEADLDQIALFQSRALDDPSWTTSEAIQMATVGVFQTLAAVWLLVHPRSPLRLRSL